ncbi:MAG: prepilin-type N-terminal cleavage/methylation domain-containing protein [Lentisphaerales bacterium]|nr:prepilin-type N-terminal cleavage/methylation domain-containing protein [Lentisphaerales bacterium]
MDSERKFSLIELLVVITIISILVSILLPSLSKARKKMRQTHCLNNQKQVMLCISLYTTENNDWYPLAIYYQFDLEPYARGQYKDFSSWMSSPYKGTIFECIENPNLGEAINSWVGGIGMNYEYMGFTEHSPTSPRQKVMSIDEPAETIMIGDSDYDKAWNLKYIYAPLNTAGFTPDLSIRYQMHGKGANYGWVDGHVSMESRSKILNGKNSSANWYFKREK